MNFTDVSFIFKNWRQPKCPSMGAWLNWYISIMECYSVKKEQTMDTYTLDNSLWDCTEGDKANFTRLYNV